MADVPAAEVAVLEDERMAGNMQVAGIPPWMLWKTLDNYPTTITKP